MTEDKKAPILTLEVDSGERPTVDMVDGGKTVSFPLVDMFDLDPKELSFIVGLSNKLGKMSKLMEDAEHDDSEESPAMKVLAEVYSALGKAVEIALPGITPDQVTKIKWKQRMQVVDTFLRNSGLRGPDSTPSPEPTPIGVNGSRASKGSTGVIRKPGSK